MITLITGPRASGKTALAKKITENKRACWMHYPSMCNFSRFSDVNENTEYIVVDELSDPSMLRFLICDKMIIERQKGRPKIITTPDIVVLSQNLTAEDFGGIKVKVIDLKLRDNPLPPKRKVIIESPYAGDIERNIEYARLCLRDSLRRGEAPIASHLLYTQDAVLDDKIPNERMMGINAGLAWLDSADAHVFYVDYGYSSGMRYAKRKSNLIVEERRIL